MRMRWAGRVIAPLAVLAFVGGARLTAFADTVKCKDGTESQSGRGACSHHGGVAAAPAAPSSQPAGRVSAPKVAPAPAPVPAPAPAQTPRNAPPSSEWQGPTGSVPPVGAPRSTTHPSHPAAQPNGRPTAQCRDGSWSYAQHHSGACSRHGGVSRWTDGTAL